MRILALETSTEFASCAFWLDGSVLSAECPADAPHSLTLIPLAKRLLQEAGSDFAALDAVAFDKGPGAFTSLRVSCAIAQGMASALDIPVLPVGSLECLAWRACEAGEKALSLLDARMGEVYVGAFRREKEGVKPLLEVGLCKPEAITLPDGEGWKVVGNALDAYPLLRERLSGQCLLSLVPHAEPLVELAVFALRRGEGIDPALALPRYVRDKVARTSAEQMATGGRV
ncbi:MAG: tRNA (adenosine(37)-N6)-threonylcarbamoyltransferase complex dimerization subunit type 1 TsaB [Betaproteobacteria bacterium]|nr:tRNA (adenosine(37)-N6)-threonylcarbamoyltransferase complex dimerization subunit type 1 TsaB [Betaproteobacteria bacterium]